MLQTSQSGSSDLPLLGVGPHRGAHRFDQSGRCLMEHVSVLAGEPFSDLPQCTHPAVAALAWRVNDEVSFPARQQLLLRAPALVGAGCGLNRPVRPVVLGVIAAAGLAVDPENRGFQRLQRRLDREASRLRGNGAGSDETHGRLRTLATHIAPVNWAMTRLAAAMSGRPRAEWDRLAVALLDDCLAAVSSMAPASPPLVGDTTPRTPSRV